MLKPLRRVESVRRKQVGGSIARFGWLSADLDSTDGVRAPVNRDHSSCRRLRHGLGSAIPPYRREPTKACLLKSGTCRRSDEIGAPRIPVLNLMRSGTSRRLVA